MPLNIPRALESLQDQGIFSAADDILDNLGLPSVMLAAADDDLENFDQVQHVLVNLAFGRLAEIEEVQQLDLETRRPAGGS